MARLVVIVDGGDGWWMGPESCVCEVCWDRPGSLQGLPGLYWLLHLSSPMEHQDALTDFHYVLVIHSGHDLAGARAFEDWGIPMYPVLRKVEPGEHVSFDGELLAGVKAGIHRP